jgi:hypothetical protein
MVTSARLRLGRATVPAKITSSMSPPRSERAEVSPIAQRSASTTLDLPQPLGPTMPVRPGRMSRQTGSAKLLKPAMRSRVSDAFKAGSKKLFDPASPYPERPKPDDAKVSSFFVSRKTMLPS